MGRYAQAGLTGAFSANQRKQSGPGGLLILRQAAGYVHRRLPGELTHSELERSLTAFPMSSTVPDDRDRYERARRRVREIRAFYVHLAVFVAVNIVLHGINLVTAPKVYWAVCPLLGWGIGVLAHGLTTYRWVPFVGQEWEERKIRELMDKDRRDA